LRESCRVKDIKKRLKRFKHIEVDEDELIESDHEGIDHNMNHLSKLNEKAEENAEHLEAHLHSDSHSVSERTPVKKEETND